MNHGKGNENIPPDQLSAELEDFLERSWRPIGDVIGLRGRALGLAFLAVGLVTSYALLVVPAPAFVTFSSYLIVAGVVALIICFGLGLTVFPNALTRIARNRRASKLEETLSGLPPGWRRVIIATDRLHELRNVSDDLNVTIGLSPILWGLTPFLLCLVGQAAVRAAFGLEGSASLVVGWSVIGFGVVAGIVVYCRVLVRARELEPLLNEAINFRRRLDALGTRIIGELTTSE